MKKVVFSIVLALLILVHYTSFAQKDTVATKRDWQLSDFNISGTYGTSVDKAYATILATLKPKRKIIVSVIDSGVDTLHEDLKSILWKNKNEIPGNRIDDDHNGYVDDVYGWNFIGGRDGKNVTKDSYEGARVYYKFKKLFENQSIEENTLSNEQLFAFKNFKKAKEIIEIQAKEASLYVMILKDLVTKVPIADSIVKIFLGKNTYTGDELENFKAVSAIEIKSKKTMLGFFQQTRQMDQANSFVLKELFDFYEQEKTKMLAVEKEPIDYRGAVVQDNYDDVNDRYYGNNDVMATGSEHGTHVSGIIAADRKNKIGITGIANNVEIMMIRAVPDGDEHDKDIANAIHYAVDNGAWVINMSFGKGFSPEKKWVDEAVKYAESKGVLLIHAAGNDDKNIDIEDNFPSKNINNDTLQTASNWINVGASGPTLAELKASFSNYGKREVSVFAPGVEIYSTLPGGNMYGSMDGTSMAAPVVSGIASLILSYYPELSAPQVKNIIEKSAIKIDSSIQIKEGDADRNIQLADISVSGGIANAYEALKLASTVKGERKLENTSEIKKRKVVKK